MNTKFSWRVDIINAEGENLYKNLLWCSITFYCLLLSRVTVGRAAVHNAKSIKLVNDIDLHHQPVDKENAPMLIVGFGKTFTIHDQAPKKLIMKTLARAAMENDQELEEEDTYWLRGETPNGEILLLLSSR